jgi:hypothetical protein
MKSITTDDIIDYFSCSYKLSFENNSDNLFSFQGVRSFIFGSLLDFCMYLKVNNEPITILKLNQRLNYLWSKCKENLTYQPKISERLVLKAHLKKFVDTFQDIDSVVYFDYPRVISLEELDIIYSFYSYIQDSSVKTIVKLDSTVPIGSVFDSGLRIVSNLIQKDIKQIEDGLDHSIYLFKVSNGEIIKAEQVNEEEVMKATTSLQKGLLNKVYLPNSSKLTCRLCLHRHECTWNIFND